MIASLDLVSALSDPRVFPAPSEVTAPVGRWHVLAREALAAPTHDAAEVVDAALRRELIEALLHHPPSVEEAIARAPGPEIARHVWRVLEAALAAPASRNGELAATVFALPVVIVAGLTVGAEPVVLPGVLNDPRALGEVLREGGALRGNRSLVLGPSLVRADALGIAELPRWRAMERLDAESEAGAATAFLVPAPIRVAPGSETVHLRFLAGRALAAKGVDLLASSGIERWGAPATRRLVEELARAAASVLPLARPPARPLPARYAGFAAQREVSAQLFVTNALRRFRASVGEAVAVVSAHRTPDAAGGGELRVSLSSPFAERDAEGFRCPLDPIETVGGVATMLVELLTDCRVTDVRVAPGIHPDRTPDGAMRRFVRPAL